MMKPGYTLLEMLVSVAIFSGLVILILGVFVRSTSSAAKVSVLREKSEVARSAMASIANDFRYIYYDKEITLGDAGDQNYHFLGYYFISAFGFNDIAMLLKYPNSTDNQLVFKRYQTANVTANSRALRVLELRGCKIEVENNIPKVYLTRCDNAADWNFNPVLPNGFVLDNDVANPAFSGLKPEPNQLVKAYAKIRLNVKPVDFSSKLCSDTTLPIGSCYKVETILTAGSLRP